MADNDEGYDVIIDADGNVSFIYADALRELATIGVASTTRASHVEPHPTRGTGWIADMTPSGGPVLGVGGEMNVSDATRADAFRYLDQDGIDAQWAKLVPFETREEALAAERDWLRKERGL